VWGSKAQLASVFTFVAMAAEIKRITFKAGLPLEIEVIPIAATVTKHQESTLHPHRAKFYHIFRFQ
jgi:hypothetical protein